MSYEKEIKHLMRELKFAKSDYLNARLKSEDALRIHSFKTDVETIEFQIEVFEKAAKVDEYEAKAKAFDRICEAMDYHYPSENDRKYLNGYQHPKASLKDIDAIINKYESGGRNE